MFRERSKGFVIIFSFAFFGFAVEFKVRNILVSRLLFHSFTIFVIFADSFPPWLWLNDSFSIFCFLLKVTEVILFGRILCSPKTPEYHFGLPCSSIHALASWIVVLCLSVAAHSVFHSNLNRIHIIILSAPTLLESNAHAMITPEMAKSLIHFFSSVSIESDGTCVTRSHFRWRR